MLIPRALHALQRRDSITRAPAIERPSGAVQAGGAEGGRTPHGRPRRRVVVIEPDVALPIMYWIGAGPLAST